MRPIATQRNELRYPLDALLGTRAQIRVLRLLAESDRPMSASEIHEHTGVSLPGTLKVLDRLARTGFLETLGSGRARLYGFDRTDVLSESLDRLFIAERDWQQSMVDRLRSLFSSLKDPVDAAWLVLDDYSLGDPLRISVMTDSKRLASSKQEIQGLLAGLEQDLLVTTELTGVAHAELPSVEHDSILLLAGYSPFERSAASSRTTSHSDLDARSLGWAERLAHLIERDPTVVTRALRYVKRTMEKSPGPGRTDLKEWRRILETYSQRQLLNFLVDTGERATRLRQSAPFVAVLSPEEKSLIRGMAKSDDA